MKFKEVLDFFHEFYLPNHNVVHSGRILGENIYFWIYFILGFFFCILIVLKIFFHIRGKISFNVTNIYQKFLLVIVLLIAGLQLQGQVVVLAKEWVYFKDKPPHLRFATEFHQTIYFAYVCRDLVKDPQAGQMITDISFDSNDGYYERLFNYFLYPVDVRNVRQEKSDEYLIYFSKANAHQYVPQKYKIIYVLDDQNLIAQKINEENGS